MTNPISMFMDKSGGRNLSLLSTLIAVVFSIMAGAYVLAQIGHIQEASAQNNTAATSQTAGPFGNLTQADLNPVTDLLDEARDFLLTNDSSSAYVRLNRADSSLFVTLNEQNAQLEQFQPVKSAIDNAKDALTQNDNAEALNDVNTANVAFLRITQQLPEGEGLPEDEAAEDEDEAAE